MQLSWRTLIAHIGNHPKIWQRGSAIAVCLVALACGSSSSTSTDTRTNWLVACSDDCDGGLTCLCGVCTQACSTDTACADFGADAVCVDTPSGCGAASEVCARDEFTFPTDLDATPAASSSPMSVNETLVSSAVADSTKDGVTTVDSGSTEGVNTGDSGSTEGTSPSGASSAGDTTSLTSSADAGVDPCDVPGRQYQSRDPLDCVIEPECGVLAEGIGNVPFSDACGCGCEPYVPPERTDTLIEAECATVSSGSVVEARLLAESEVSAIACGNAVSALLRSQAAVDDWAADTGCQALLGITSIIDFSSEALIIAGTPDYPAASVEYVSQTIDGVFHVGVTARAYCSGAPPAGGFVLLTVPASPSSAVIARVETCYEACGLDGGLPPP